MTSLKSLLILLLFSINYTCHAMQVKCSVCHKSYEKTTSGSSACVCPDCKKLIKLVKEWKQYCYYCDQYVAFDLCPTCLETINENRCDSCKEDYTVCVMCADCLEKNIEKIKKCKANGCRNNISLLKPYGYYTGLCETHNEELKTAIKTRKEKCENCKMCPLLDLCPACLDKISNDHCTTCKWEGTYSPYVPCVDCLKKHALE